MPDLADLLASLRSGDPEVRSAAVERAAVAVERLVHAVVDSLERSGPHVHYVAEHVHRFGTLMVEPLEALLARTRDADTKKLCALLLIRLHSRAGVDVLLRAVADDAEWSAQVAGDLAQAGVEQAVGPIVHRLRAVPLEREDEIVALLRALRQLHGSVPADLVERFSSPTAPPEAQAFVQETMALATGSSGSRA